MKTKQEIQEQIKYYENAMLKMRDEDKDRTTVENPPQWNSQINLLDRLIMELKWVIG